MRTLDAFPLESSESPAIDGSFVRNQHCKGSQCIGSQYKAQPRTPHGNLALNFNELSQEPLWSPVGISRTLHDSLVQAFHDWYTAPAALHANFSLRVVHTRNRSKGIPSNDDFATRRAGFLCSALRKPRKTGGPGSSCPPGKSNRPIWVSGATKICRHVYDHISCYRALSGSDRWGNLAKKTNSFVDACPEIL